MHKRLVSILVSIVGLVVFLTMVILLVAIIMYKSGEVSLKANASDVEPIIIENNVQLNLDKTIAWEDDWVSFEDKVYEYNDDSLNFLILGIDNAGELSKTTDVSDVDAGQADTIFLVSLNNTDKTISVIAIPRNSMIEVNIFDEDEKKIDTIYNQICLQYAYAGGGSLGLDEMKNAVSKLFYGLPIHGACALSFDAIGILADELGGIDIVVPEDLTYVNSSWIQGSTLTLDSKNIMNYLRYRGTAFKSSTNRLNRQKDFMKYAMCQAMTKIKEEPSLVSDLYEKVLPYMNTDLSLNEAVYIATDSLSYSISDANFMQLSGEDVKVDMLVPTDENYTFFDDLYLDDDVVMNTMISCFYKEVVLN